MINIFKLTPFTLFGFQALCHLATVWWVVNRPTWVEAAIVFTIYFFTGCVGMTVTYHRLLTHRSWKAPRWFEILGTLCAMYGGTGSSLSWTAAHRQHHRFSDKHGDPHSPTTLGYLRAQFGSMFSPVDIRRSPVLGDRFHGYAHRYYVAALIVFAAFNLFVFGWRGLVVNFLVPACVLWNAGSLINTVCHTRWLGYRPYNVPDASVNNPVLGLLMWGEGWHNNHHRHQAQARIGERWWEIDVGWWVIKLFRKQ